MWPDTGRHLRHTGKDGLRRGRNQEVGGRRAEKMKANGEQLEEEEAATS